MQIASKQPKAGRLLWRLVAAFWISIVFSVLFIKFLTPEPTDANFVWSLLARIGVVAVVSGTAFLLATRSIARPLEWLRSAAKNLGEGKLSTRVAARRDKAPHEVESLVSEFNAMAGRVEELVSSQRQLIADVSHELRSPLARLTLAVELLRRSPEDSQDCLDRCDQEITRLNLLIERLLTLSRLESSVVVLKQESFDLADLVSEVIDDVQFEASAKGCSVRCVRSEDCPVRGDFGLLRSAVENVMRNAVKYSPEGSSVVVSLICKGPECEVTVEDNGPGLSEKDLREMFRPFYRGDAARRDTKGYGLGLAIASRAVRLHNGTIVAANTPSGLAVCIHLPILN